MASNAIKRNTREQQDSKSEGPKKRSSAASRKSTQKQSKETASRSQAIAHGPRPLWTGVIAFGLVSMPVSLYSATRHWGSSLKMVDASGQPLNRKYRCEKDDVELSGSDIIRGYEIEKDRFVTLEDDELRALAPEKSSEINLQKFISLDDIHPIYFDKSYFLVPDAAAVRAYRLLAESMATERRAGIATFVMRDKEYLVAIISESGILSAETLRFHDEIRTPGEIGLPPAMHAQKSLVKKLESLIGKYSATELDRKELEDLQTQRLKDLVAGKLKKGIDVIIKEKPKAKRQPEIGDEYGSEMEAVDKVIDLMKVLKSRIEKDSSRSSRTPEAPLHRRNSSRSTTPLHSRKSSRAVITNQSKSFRSGDKKQKLGELTREELYEKAKAMKIEGRSRMTKQQLIEILSG